MQAQNRRIGGLGLRGVLAEGLADAIDLAFDIEDVVANLEGQADAMAVAFEGSEHGRIAAACSQGAEAHRSADQGAGLVHVHAFEVMDTENLADRGEV